MYIYKLQTVQALRDSMGTDKFFDVLAESYKELFEERFIDAEDYARYLRILGNRSDDGMEWDRLCDLCDDLNIIC